jgi:hypothetical protein
MSKVSEVIAKLQELQDENGDRECTIYKRFDKETQAIVADNIYFDEANKDIYIGIYY